MQPRNQLNSLIDRLFLIDGDIKTTDTKNLINVKIDNSFIEKYQDLKYRCDYILLKIKNRKEKTETILVK